MTLQEAASGIAAFAQMQASPGALFTYGGASMQVAGAAAEVVGGAGWADLFTTRIASPLGMNQTDYLGIGTAANPRIAEGIRSSVDNIADYLQMLGNVKRSRNPDPGSVRESSCLGWGWKGFSDEEATQCRADRGLASAG